MIDFLTTFSALRSVYIDESFSNIAINEAVEQHPGCSTGFVRTFTKGVIRDTLRLDHYIDQLASKGIKGIKSRTLIVLRMGIYAIDKLDSVPEYAAIDLTVGLAKKVCKGQDKFVNGVLRSYTRQRCELDTCGTFPEELEQLIRSQYGDEADRLMEALDTPAPLVLRPNRLKTRQTEPIISDGGKVLSGEDFREGKFSVQSLSSIEAIEHFAPHSGARVLDMCAAPGGKSCAMAEIMGNEGEIIACDIYEHRLDLINAQAKRLGIDIIKTELLDGTVHRAEWENQFDYVLADVPCSGLGVIPTKPEIKLRTDVNSYAELREIQYKILMNAISYVKPGGKVEYSTCTINKDENQGVVNNVLEHCNLAQTVENISILPYNNKVGFYYCILKKDNL